MSGFDIKILCDIYWFFEYAYELIINNSTLPYLLILQVGIKDENFVYSSNLYLWINYVFNTLLLSIILHVLLKKLSIKT